MSLLRNAFLKISENDWLRERANRYEFLQRSVRRFLPGEALDDAITAARLLAESGVFSVLARVGENVTQRAEAEEVTRRYEEALDQVRAANLAVETSVKLTQLGLDLDAQLCRENLLRILERSHPDRAVWIDMEHSSYVDVTIDVYRRAREIHKNTGICLQAYLFRTEKDLAALIRDGGSVRLVKGAYNEPPEIAFAEKRDVDENFLHLAKMLLSSAARIANVRGALATHDRTLIAQIRSWGLEQGIPQAHIEFQMLYGIQRAEQIRLAREGYRSGVLISYGQYWFPWFMRRLAERPANALFVARNLFTR